MRAAEPLLSFAQQARIYETNDSRRGDVSVRRVCAARDRQREFCAQHPAAREPAAGDGRGAHHADPQCVAGRLAARRQRKRDAEPRRPSGPATGRSSMRISMGKDASEVRSTRIRPEPTSSPQANFRRTKCPTWRSPSTALRSERANGNHLFRYAALILRRSFSARRKSCDFTFEPVTSCQRITGSS